MKRKNIRIIENPYQNISEDEYQNEKRRLQLELLKIQQWLVRKELSLVVVFEGRDAAGKGSTIKRFTENLIPAHFSIHALGVPSQSESKYWFSDMNHCSRNQAIWHFLIDLGIQEH